MDRELQDYFENRFTTMASPGWKDFIEDTQALYDVYEQVNTVNSVEELYKRKGQLDILQWVLNLKNVSEQTYKELQDEEAV
jgi:hypothetical protein